MKFSSFFKRKKLTPLEQFKNSKHKYRTAGIFIIGGAVLNFLVALMMQVSDTSIIFLGYNITILFYLNITLSVSQNLLAMFLTAFFALFISALSSILGYFAIKGRLIGLISCLVFHVLDLLAILLIPESDISGVILSIFVHLIIIFNILIGFYWYVKLIKLYRVLKSQTPIEFKNEQKEKKDNK